MTSILIYSVIVTKVDGLSLLNIHVAQSMILTIPGVSTFALTFKLKVLIEFDYD